MDKTSAIMDLVAGYDAYGNADELAVGAVADAPASTPFCVGLTVSIAVSGTVGQTINGGC